MPMLLYGHSAGADGREAGLDRVNAPEVAIAECKNVERAEASDADPHPDPRSGRKGAPVVGRSIRPHGDAMPFTTVITLQTAHGPMQNPEIKTPGEYGRRRRTKRRAKPMTNARTSQKKHRICRPRKSMQLHRGNTQKQAKIRKR